MGEELAVTEARIGLEMPKIMKVVMMKVVVVMMCV